MDKREFIRKCIIGIGGSCIPYHSFALNTLFEYKEPELKEAQFYSITPKGIKCHICPNECTIKPGQLADCRNRIYKNEKLLTLAYGNPCSVHLDPVEKLPLYHFLPSSYTFSIGVAGCNLACLNCQNWQISQFSPNETKNFNYMPDRVVSEAIKNECKSIAFTYSEPVTFYEYVYDTSILAKEQNIKSIIKTSGYINEKPLQKLCKVIDAANVDLKSFSNEIYLKLNAGKLKPILNTLKILKEEGVWLEITNLIIPSWTDSPEMIRQMCGWLAENGFEENPLHFGRFYPDYKLKGLPPTSIKMLLEAVEIAQAEGLKFVYVGNIPGNDVANTICPSCNKTVVERRGYRILRNNLANNMCSYCQYKIDGLWI